MSDSMETTRMHMLRASSVPSSDKGQGKGFLSFTLTVNSFSFDSLASATTYFQP